MSKDPSLADLAQLRFRHPDYFLSVTMFSDASQIAWGVVLVKDGLNQQMRDYWINLEGDIKGAVSRQSSSFCLILPITHPQLLWNLKLSKEITCK